MNTAYDPYFDYERKLDDEHERVTKLDYLIADAEITIQTINKLIDREKYEIASFEAESLVTILQTMNEVNK